MKRILDRIDLSDRGLAFALIFLIAGSAFALLNAFGGTGATFTFLTPMLLAA